MSKTYNILEVFTVHFRSTKVLVHVNKDGSENTEEGTETEHHKVADTFTQWWLSTKEGILACKCFERGDVNSRHGCILMIETFSSDKLELVVIQSALGEKNICKNFCRWIQLH